MTGLTLHPCIHARTHPDKPACVIAASGEVITYRQLDERSNQGAHLLRSLGLERGDVVALFMENHPRYLDIAWASQRSGLYWVCISSKLTAPEVEYIVNDCGAKVFITSPAMGEVGRRLASLLSGIHLYMVGDGAVRRIDHGSKSARRCRSPPIEDESSGADMLYSSGTTGRPKGVKFALPSEADRSPDDARAAREQDLRSVCRFGVPVAGAALSRSAAALVHDDAASRRHRRHDGSVRSGAGAVADRATSGHACAMGADAFRALPEAGPRGARSLRRLIAAQRHSRRRAVPDPDQAADDRLVGARSCTSTTQAPRATA